MLKTVWKGVLKGSRQVLKERITCTKSGVRQLCAHRGALMPSGNKYVTFVFSTNILFPFFSHFRNAPTSKTLFPPKRNTHLNRRSRNGPHTIEYNPNEGSGS